MANTKITSRVIADDAILTANIADDQITSALIADDVALGGNPTTSTQIAGNNTTRIATTAFVSTAVANIVNSAPATLDTLGEIATALNNDAALNTTLTNSIAAKLPLAGGTMTGNIVMGDDTSIGIADDAERIEFDGAGDISLLGANVGINDTTPDALFTVKGSADSYAGGLRLEGFNETTALGIAHVDGDNFFSGNATDDHLVLKSDGKVGIGGSPDTLLNLKDTGGIEVRLEADSNNSGQEDCFIRFYTDGKTQEGIAGMDNNNSSTLFSGNTENAMVFGTVSNLPVVLATNNTERLQISAAGKVGIGIASPSNLLHVNIAGSNDVGTTISNGQYDYTWGIDTSDSAQFKLSRHTGLGNYDLIKFHPTTYNVVIPSGSLHIGTTATTGVASGGLRLTFPSNESDGDLFFVSNGGGSNATPVLMYVVQAEGFSTNHGALAVGRHTGNNRSINAGGTINASGADYAEYMVKSSGCGDIAKGDVVGVDADGKLTKTFSAAKSFVIKSTDPSYVGGDTWWTEKEPEPKYTDDTKSTKTDNFKDWETRMETARGTVDRIAFSGQVPVNITGSFNVGDYVYPQVNSSGIKAVAKSSPTFEEYQLCVGKIWTTMDDGRPLVAVKIG